jgi:peroxiredoxin
MSTMPATPQRPRWIKPVAIGAAVLAIAVATGLVMNTRTAAPEVTFISLTGEKISSQNLRGKVFIVNFWATDCATCIKEMPQMIETYKKFNGQGLEFLAVAMKGDPPNYVINFTETRQLPFKVALDSNGELAKAFGDVKMTPTTFVIDKQGKILKRYVGEPDFGTLHQLLQKALAG